MTVHAPYWPIATLLLGRDAIGIDLDHRNATLAEERVGPMFLTIEHLSEPG